MNESSREKVGLQEIGLAGPQWADEDGEPAEARARETIKRGPDPEVLEKIPKRKFSVDYKARIVREADACTETGQIGALLRREGLYSSQLAQWRRAYRQGALAALRDNKRGRKPTRHPLEAENERLKRANLELEKRLEQAEAIIDVQKKLSGLMGIPLGSEESKGKN